MLRPIPTLSFGLCVPTALCMLSACQAPGEQAIDRTVEAIIGGTLDSGDPSVVAVLMTTNQGQALCTAEVIAPTVLLTAAHCVSPAELGPGAQFDIVTGPSANGGPSGQIRVQEVHNDQAFNTNHPEYGHDVGIIILSTPLSLTPLAINRGTMTQALVGQAARLVGYGLSNARSQTGAGTKRQVTTQLDDFDSMLLHIGGSGKDSCSGDSGGPAFMSINGVETIMGVTSFGDQNCSTGGYYTRIDQYLSFIDQYLPTTTCTPQCGGKGCGSDGCGGSCGSCGSSASCSAAGQCVSSCAPQCSGRSCGADGCGGTCGSCGSGTSCDNAGLCVSSTPTNPCDGSAGNEAEPNEVQPHSNVLCGDGASGVVGRIRGTIGSAGDEDWFSFTLNANQGYTVQLTHQSPDLSVRLYKLLDGAVVLLGDGTQTISRYSATGGAYWLEVSSSNGNAGQSYELRVTTP